MYNHDGSDLENKTHLDKWNGSRITLLDKDVSLPHIITGKLVLKQHYSLENWLKWDVKC